MDFFFFSLFLCWKVLFLVVYKFSKFKHRSEAINADCLPQNNFGLLGDFLFFIFFKLKQCMLKGSRRHAVLRNFKLYLLLQVFDDP